MKANQPKQLILFFLLFCFFTNVYGQRRLRHDPIPFKLKYPEKYKDQLESNTKLIAALYHVTVEKTQDGKYIRKQYYPSTKQITLFETYSDKKLTILDGQFKRWSEDGLSYSEGIFENNKAIGEWKEYSNTDGKTYLKSKGMYENGKKEGAWESYDEQGNIVKTTKYIKGRMDSPYRNFTPEQRDSLRKVSATKRAKSPKKSTEGKVFKVVEKMPMFPGCEETEGRQAQKKCADAEMMKFIYGNLKYPEVARKEGIQGRSIVSFVVSKTGEIKDIKVLKGICEEIKQESIRVVELMPKWIPGTQRGESVDVQFTLPIRFKLEGSNNSVSRKSKKRKRKRRF